MAFVQIPLSNTLRMVRTDNQDGTLQNFDNRLLHQEAYTDYNVRPYLQKVSSVDSILIQFATDLTTVTAEVYNIDGSLLVDKSGDITLIQSSTSFNIYNLLFQIATQGQYYLQLTFTDGVDTEIWQSEWFQIDGYVVENLIKIEYNTGDNDGISYLNNETFIIRVEGRLVEVEHEQESEVYDNYNESLSKLNSFAKRSPTLELGAIPRYMAEKLNLALTHEVFKVNDVKYQSKDAADIDFLKADINVTNLYTGKLKLQQENYEIYTEATDDVAPTTNHILIDENQGKLIIRDQGINNFTRYKD